MSFLLQVMLDDAIQMALWEQSFFQTCAITTYDVIFHEVNCDIISSKLICCHLSRMMPIGQTELYIIQVPFQSYFSIFFNQFYSLITTPSRIFKTSWLP